MRNKIVSSRESSGALIWQRAPVGPVFEMRAEEEVRSEVPQTSEH